MEVNIDHIKSKNDYLGIALACLEQKKPFVSFNKKRGHVISYFLPDVKAVVNTSMLSSGVFVNLSDQEFINHVKLALVCEGIRMVNSDENLMKPYQRVINMKKQME